MISKYGKLFKDLDTSQISCFQYNTNQNYYTFIQEMQQKGFHQCIVTSDIMIKVVEHFILKGNVEITSIEFMVEDDELEDEINTVLKSMRQNAGYWDILKQKLSFLSENDSIEVKRVNFRSLKGSGYLFSIQVNGVIVVSESEFGNISGIISKIMEGCIK
ncbi:MAG: hypothetical protein E7211_20645 [Clostridium lundense]|nr:hypothetical protein [Clostridium lundense]